MTSTGQKARTICKIHINGTQELFRNRLDFMKACTLWSAFNKHLCISYASTQDRNGSESLASFCILNTEYLLHVPECFWDWHRAAGWFGMKSIRLIMKNSAVLIVLLELESVNLNFQISWNDLLFFTAAAFPQNMHVRTTKLHLSQRLLCQFQLVGSNKSQLFCCIFWFPE